MLPKSHPVRSTDLRSGRAIQSLGLRCVNNIEDISGVDESKGRRGDASFHAHGKRVFQVITPVASGKRRK